MLRKTNYNRPEDNSTTYEFNQSNQQQSFQAPKLRPTGRRFEDNASTQFGAANKFGQQQQQQQQQTSSSYSDNYTTNNRSSMERADEEEQGNNDEEEYEI